MGPERKQSGAIIRRAQEMAMESILPRVDKITNATKISFPPQFQEHFLEAISEGYVPVLYSNHQSWYDGLPLARLTSRLLEISNASNRKINGFMLLVAASLPNGEQDPTLKRAYDFLTGKMEEGGITPLPYVRPKDEKKYGMTNNKMAFMIKAMNGFKNGMGMAMFAEGSVEGGRKNGTGGINGMRYFEEGTLEVINTLLKRLGKKALFVPIGLSGSYKVLSPDTKRPTMAAIMAIYGLGNLKLVNMRVGNPIGSDDLSYCEGSSGQMNLVLAKEVAELLPEEERGVFRKRRLPLPIPQGQTSIP